MNPTDNSRIPEGERFVDNIETVIATKVLKGKKTIIYQPTLSDKAIAQEGEE